MAYAITIRGGRRVQNFILDFPNFANIQVLHALRDVIDTHVIQPLRARLPRRSGRLYRTLHVVVRDGGLQVRGVFYGRLVHLRQPIAGKRSLPEIVLELIGQQREAIRGAVRRELQTLVRQT